MKERDGYLRIVFDYDEILNWLKANQNNRFCIVDYRLANNEYEIIYRVIGNNLLRKKWDTENWYGRRFQRTTYSQLKRDIIKANKFQFNGNPNMYTKKYTYELD